MLQMCDNYANVLNFWYKISCLKDEIKKRTSYLGKFRRTEEAKHLLDLIAMTEDEEDMFYPLVNEAMADVFDELEKYAPKRMRSFIWNEDVPVVQVQGNMDEFHAGELVEYKNKLYMAWLDNIIEPITIKFYNENIGDVVATRDEANDGSVEDDNFPFCFSTEDSVKYYCQVAAPSVGDYVSFDKTGLISTEAINEVSGGWDGIPIEEKLVETYDWRHSIHYVLKFPKEWNVNVAIPLDTAIFESLVARIIYKWLLYVYPDDAPRFLAEWNEGVEKIRKRCWQLFGVKVVNRIPRQL